MKRTIGIVVVASLACSLGVATRAHADPILVVDQVSNPTFGAVGGGFVIDTAQTFTAGLTGILREIDVALAVPMGSDEPLMGTLLFQVRPVLGDLPSSLILAQQTLPGSAIPRGPLWTFDVFFTNLSVPIVAGEQFAIVLGSRGDPEGSSNYGWVIDRSGPYAAGALFQQEHDSAGQPVEAWHNISSFGGDAAFRTIVEAAPIQPTPEPASALLLAAGAALLARRGMSDRFRGPKVPPSY
jgi:hypothetical protein